MKKIIDFSLEDVIDFIVKDIDSMLAVVDSNFLKGLSPTMIVKLVANRESPAADIDRLKAFVAWYKEPCNKVFIGY